MAKRKITVAGNTIYVSISTGRIDRIPGEKRVKRNRPTSKEMELLNQRYAERSLQIIINSNFREGDYHIVLTYAKEPPTLAEAKQTVNLFKRRLRNLYKRFGVTLKWVLVTEYQNKRIHHHLVCSGGVELAEIAKIWGRGLIRSTLLDGTGDYRRLATYLTKETTKTMREEEGPKQKRYTCSKNIVHPKPVVQEVKTSAIFKEPKPFAGYYIDQDSIYRGCNPETGHPYLEYIMVSMDAEPRITRWNKGRKTKDTRPEFERWLRKNRETQTRIELEEWRREQ